MIIKRGKTNDLGKVKHGDKDGGRWHKKWRGIGGGIDGRRIDKSGEEKGS